MSTPSLRTGLQIRSTITHDGFLELSLAEAATPQPNDDEVIVRVEAAPLNPSDMGLLFGATDMSSAETSGTPDRPTLRARVSPAEMRAQAARIGQSLPAGNEGAGTVVEAGSSPVARTLLGRTVAVRAGGMYSQYRCVRAEDCLVLPPGTSAAEGAACFVNPLTVLGMVETMRREGHKALVHTAAASNLGQMLIRLCNEDHIGLVNIVRNDEQVDFLKSLGAAHVLNSTSPTFMEDLVEALGETGATLAFDAVGGGRLAGQILSAMEAAAMRGSREFSRYGSAVHKQLYFYGSLDRTPTEFVRNFGTAWGMGGWLLSPFLERIGPEAVSKLKSRVAAEIKTTFASSYARQISLAEVLHPDQIAVYTKRATGGKYLVNPNKGL